MPQVSAVDGMEPFRCSTAVAALLVINMSLAVASSGEHDQVSCTLLMPFVILWMIARL